METKMRKLWMALLMTAAVLAVMGIWIDSETLAQTARIPPP